MSTRTDHRLVNGSRTDGNGSTAPVQATDFATAYPNSRKVYVEGRYGVRVPMREIVLSGGEPPLRVYDTSGPQGVDVREGLPPLRSEWILARGDVEVVEGRSQAAMV